MEQKSPTSPAGVHQERHNGKVLSENQVLAKSHFR